jgi:nicotinate-nucleotide adenylyltransferase
MLDLHTARRLIVFGGTFDPPHLAHIDLPFHIADFISADGVVFIPAGSPPHKSRSLTPAPHRLAMLRLALGDRPDAAICTAELDRPGPSYTVDTLRQLRDQLHPATQLRLLIGADMAAIFYQWRDPQQIIQLADPLVMMRPPIDPASLLARLPADLDQEQRQAWTHRIVPAPLIDIDSTRLRLLLSQGRFDDPLVTRMLAPSVIHYIREHHLYAAAR